jgi:hypothetical protein
MMPEMIVKCGDFRPDPPVVERIVRGRIERGGWRGVESMQTVTGKAGSGVGTMRLFFFPN